MTDCVLGLIVRTKATGGGTFHVNYRANLNQVVLSTCTRRCTIKNIFLSVKPVQQTQAKVRYRHFQCWAFAQGLDGASLLPMVARFHTLKISKLCQRIKITQVTTTGNVGVSSMLTCSFPRCRGFRSLLREGRPCNQGRYCGRASHDTPLLYGPIDPRIVSQMLCNFRAHANRLQFVRMYWQSFA